MTTDPVDVRRFTAAESSPRIGRIPTPTGYAGLGDINSYLIFPEHPDDGLVLIDTGINSESAWETLNQGLQSLDHRIEDIHLIVLTHGHTDHYGQARRIHEISSCKLLAHENLWLTNERMRPPPERRELELFFYQRWGVDAELVKKSLARRDAVAESYDPLEPDRLLTDGSVVEIPGFDLQTIHTPGHCPDEVVYWQPDCKVFFSGDHMLPHITPVCLTQIPRSADAERPPALIEYRDSLAKVSPYPARVTYPSHGEPITNHCELISSYQLATERRMLKISRILEKSGSMSPMEIGKELFPKAWQDQMVPVMSEVLGHCDLLEEGGHVAQELKHGIIHYRYISTPPPQA